MLRFSSSIGCRAPVLGARTKLASPTTTNTSALSSSNGDKNDEQGLSTPIYVYEQNPVIEEGCKDDDAAPSTQEETLTLSVSEPCGFTQMESLTQIDEQQADAGSCAGPSYPRVSDKGCLQRQILTQLDCSEEQKDGPESRQPVHGVRMPKYSLPQKRYILAEAFSAPKRICMTARKYNVANATIHHWKHY